MYTPVSGFCLLGSCISAIAAVGCVFELSSGDPQLGATVTTAILIFAVPLTAIFLYAAVRDANANS
jgi:hypothetical protein